MSPGIPINLKKPSSFGNYVTVLLVSYGQKKIVFLFIYNSINKLLSRSSRGGW